MAEYYLIGALVSITFALLVGIVVRAIQGEGYEENISFEKEPFGRDTRRGSEGEFL